ncbi:MAG: hypothetical protein ACI9MC_004212 [Kiritimatiellia bacterium]
MMALDPKLKFGFVHALASCVWWAFIAAMSWGLLALRLETWMIHDRP